MKKSVKNTRMKVLLSVLPIALVFLSAKFLIHYAHLEIIPKEIMAFFPSALTSIVFVLGFILAGVVSDYKESERMPNEIASSIYIIWQETFQLTKYRKNPEGPAIAAKLLNLTKLYKEAILKGKFENIQTELVHLLNQFMANEKDIPAQSFIRIKLEIAGLKKYLNRIKIIKDTDFAPSVFFTIKIVACIFLSMSLFLKFETWWGGAIMTTFFSFMIFTVMYVIKDLEDPFQYADDCILDEINLDVIDNLSQEIETLNNTILIS